MCVLFIDACQLGNEVSQNLISPQGNCGWIRSELWWTQQSTEKSAVLTREEGREGRSAVAGKNGQSGPIHVMVSLREHGGERENDWGRKGRRSRRAADLI